MRETYRDFLDREPRRPRRRRFASGWPSRAGWRAGGFGQGRPKSGGSSAESTWSRVVCAWSNSASSCCSPRRPLPPRTVACRRCQEGRGEAQANQDILEGHHQQGSPPGRPGTAPATPAPAGTTPRQPRRRHPTPRPPAKSPSMKTSSAAGRRQPGAQNGRCARGARAQSDVSDALQSKINALWADFTARDDPSQRAQLELERKRSLAEQERVKGEIETRKKAIADLEEEARKAGVPRGWISMRELRIDD